MAGKRSTRHGFRILGAVLLVALATSLPGSDGIAGVPDGSAAPPDGFATLPDGFATLPDGFAALPDGVAVVPPAAPGDGFPFCAWWLETTASTMNVALPDTGAAYWTTPFRAEPGLRIQVDGTYADARYSSLNAYDNDFGSFSRNGAESALADYQIAASRGSLNPWRVPSRPGGTWSVTLTRHATRGRRNVLPLLPRGESAGELPAGTGFLIYRVYLPAGGDFARVPLPAVTLVHADGSRTPLPRCGQAPTLAQLASAGLRAFEWLLDPGAFARHVAENGVQPCGKSCTNAPLQFFRPEASVTNTLFPNVNNAYLAALVTPEPGQIAVVRGLAPRSPTSVGQGTSPTPWPRPEWQVRYWSMCSNVWVAPFPVVVDRTAEGTISGCAADRDTVLDPQGRYTYVVSRPEDRPAGATAGNDITWLPFSSEPRYRDQPQALVLRNMLPNRHFAEAIQNVPENAEAADAASVMGDYYPVAALCSVATFAAGGVDACLGAAGATEISGGSRPD